ncbi:hypothetical protein LF1_27900 [Rubripirellula obstinata]|uniref:Secreted protein n=1 Tax=Rubripirellula obstinata TaxID=406547 RepID=A0A5B1CJ22_9BACT|nr:hypothetical protein [Rubripirellula obstinata]KAA1260251.1 hypothetical protein LF1_27900 [Rubripirellula obstinata]
MKLFHLIACLPSALLFFAVGCGDGSNGTTATQDEMTRYLEEHPEMADPNPSYEKDAVTTD